MPLLDAGVFVLLLGTAVVSLLLSFTLGAVLKVLACVLFFSLALVMFGVYDVAYVETFTGTADCTINNPCITTKYLIRDNQQWIAWILVAFGLFSAMMFFLEMFGVFEPKQEQGAFN